MSCPFEAAHPLRCPASIFLRAAALDLPASRPGNQALAAPFPHRRKAQLNLGALARYRLHPQAAVQFPGATFQAFEAAAGTGLLQIETATVISNGHPKMSFFSLDLRMDRGGPECRAT